MNLLVSLFAVPLIFALLIALSPSVLRRLLVITATVLLSASSIAFVYVADSAISLELPALFSPLFVVADFALLGYFAYQGYAKGDWRATALAALQAIGLVALLVFMPHAQGSGIIADALSGIMIALVCIVGGAICVYALDYMDDETSDERRKSLFCAILVGFLGIMNFLVCANNLEWFYLAFELTTLASYLLIGFRGDEISSKNAMLALWMNQIGGVAIVAAMLCGAFLADTIYLDALLANSSAQWGLLPLTFLLVGGLVKGAQLPFQSWLLGAMVAPTPVSAILHSSTMVKIAPFIALKLSSALAGTAVAFFAALLGGAVFASCAALALAEHNFKRILAYSTISLLGLMILCAMAGTPLATLAALLLMLFHGVSKALLFMQAGVLEKRYHLKEVENMSGLISYAPITALLVVIGLVSVALPPFGVFLGKWMAFEATANVGQKLSSVLWITLMAVGGVVLSLLYFKVAGRLVCSDGEECASRGEKQNGLYLLTSLFLAFLLLIGALGVAPLAADYLASVAHIVAKMPPLVHRDGLTLVTSAGVLKVWQIVLALLLLVGSLLLAARFRLRGIDSADAYNCGEREVGMIRSSYFTIPGYLARWISLGGGILFAVIIVSGALR